MPGKYPGPAIIGLPDFLEADADYRNGYVRGWRSSYNQAVADLQSTTDKVTNWAQNPIKSNPYSFKTSKSQLVN